MTKSRKPSHANTSGKKKIIVDDKTEIIVDSHVPVIVKQMPFGEGIRKISKAGKPKK